MLPKPKIIQAHETLKSVYVTAEHGCALAYAACEFLNAHALIVGLSGALLGAAVMIAGLMIAEKALG